MSMGSGWDLKSFVGSGPTVKTIHPGICAMVKSRVFLGMVIPPFNRNPCNGYINPGLMSLSPIKWKCHGSGSTLPGTYPCVKTTSHWFMWVFHVFLRPNPFRIHWGRWSGPPKRQSSTGCNAPCWTLPLLTSSLRACSNYICHTECSTSDFLSSFAIYQGCKESAKTSGVRYDR